MKMQTVSILALPLLALAACSGGGGGGADKDGDGKISKEEVAREAESIKFSPGEWENKVEMLDVDFAKSKMPPQLQDAMKQQVGKPQAVKNCLTKEQASKPGADFLAGADSGECAYKTLDLSDGKVNAVIACKGKQPGQQGDIKLTGTYTATSYDMQMDMVMSSKEFGSMTMKAKNSGKRIGECKA